MFCQTACHLNLNLDLIHDKKQFSFHSYHMPVNPRTYALFTQVALTYSLFYLSFERSSACSFDLESKNEWGNVWRKVTDKTTSTKCCPVFLVHHVYNAKLSIYMIHYVHQLECTQLTFFSFFQHPPTKHTHMLLFQGCKEGKASESNGNQRKTAWIVFSKQISRPM